MNTTAFAPDGDAATPLTVGNATPVWGPEQSYGLGAEVARLESYAFYVGRGASNRQAKRHTVTEMTRRYTRDVLPAKKSARDQARQLKWWEGEIGDYTLADLTPALIVECRDKLRTTRGPATVNRYLAAISHVFTVARKEWQWVKENPLLNVSSLKEPRGRVRFLSDDERDRLLRACEAHSHQLYTIVVLALSTGARQGELLSLRWKDVDLKRGLIILEDTKNNDRRAIPLQGHALELIKIPQNFT